MTAGHLQNEYRFDLFISYASADDRPVDNGGPWVSRLVTRLESTLEMRVGVKPRIWFNRLNFSENSQLEPELRDVLRSSALFMPILSPSFAATERCSRELDYFLEHAGPERVLKVVKFPADRPYPLPNVLAYEFFGNADGHPEELVDQPYYAVLNKLAWQVRFLLTSINKSNPALAPRQPEMEVFLCHSSGDKAAVRTLWHRLKTDGFAPWLDEKELLPGQRWENEIQSAIDRAGAIVVCLSTGSISKEGYLQREIKQVLDKAAEIPEDAIFLIPARLEECPVPRRLSELQWVNLFEDAGYDRLLQALQMRAASVSRQPRKA